MATWITNDVSEEPIANVLKKKQEEIYSSKTSVFSYQIRQCHNPGQHNVNLANCFKKH